MCLWERRVPSSLYLLKNSINCHFSKSFYQRNPLPSLLNLLHLELQGTEQMQFDALIQTNDLFLAENMLPSRGFNILQNLVEANRVGGGLDALPLPRCLCSRNVIYVNLEALLKR